MESTRIQAAFRSISRGKVVPKAGDEGCWENSLSVNARLIAEDNNPHDRTVVRVDVDGRTVGYLPREDAAGLHHQLAAVHRRGTQTGCEGRIVLASNGEYAIYLHLSDSDAVGFALTLSHDYISVDGPFHAEVSGEQHHQDALRQVGPPAGGEKTVMATLAFCDVGKGKYAGEQAVEVRIGGQRIGQLGRMMSVRYSPHVQAAIALGKIPACRAVLRNTDGNKVEVTARVPRVDRAQETPSTTIPR